MEQDATIVADYEALRSSLKVAKKHGISKRTVLRVLEREGVETRDRGREKAARQAAVRELEERCVPRMQMRAELKRLGFPISQSQLQLDLAELGYGQRRPRKHPKPKPRQCLNRGDPDCPHHEHDGWFTPKDASQVARGDGWCCSPLCARRSPAGRDVGRKAATARHQRADEELAGLNEDGYMSTRQAAEWLGIAESSLYEILPPVERRLVEGEQLRLVRERDVKALARERLASPWVSYYDDPANYVVHLDSLGVPVARARLLSDARREARKRHGRVRIGTGRPKGAGPPDYHHEWAARFASLKTEMDALYVVYHVDGDPPPTNLGVALLVAEDDHAEYPDRWVYDPRERADNAARRVWKAVKPLVSAVTETRAA